MRFPLLLLLALLSSCVPVPAANNTVPPPYSSNTFTWGGDNRLYSKVTGFESCEFRDDFDGETMGRVKFLQRLTPSGHRYFLAGDANGTNGLQMRGGKLLQTLPAPATFYLTGSNSHPQGRIWTRWGMVFRYTGNLTNGFSTASMIQSERHELFTGGSSSFLHLLLQVDGSFNIQSNTTLNLGNGQSRINWFNDWVYWEVNVYSNAVVTQINETYHVTMHTNLHNIARWPCVQWEHFRPSAIASVTMEIDKVWADYARPEGSIVTMSGGLAGSVTLTGGAATVLNRYVTPNSRIFLTPFASANVLSAVGASNIVTTNSFRVHSTSAADANRVDYQIFP